MSPKTEITYEEYARSRQTNRNDPNVSYDEYIENRFPDTYRPTPQPQEVPRVINVSPQDEKQQIENIVDWSDMFDQNILTMQQMYEPVSQLMKSIPDPKDVSIQNEVEPPMGIRAAKGEEGKEAGIANTLLGFKYPPKPPSWDRASPIEKFNFITLPISDIMGRIGGKIASDWRMMKKEDVQKLLVSDLDESLKWYQKSPEAIGWTAEKVAEYLVLKGAFKASGLHKALTAAGQKVASPFIAKEITAAGGMKAISTWSAAGIKGLVKKGMTSFLTAAPENAAFISSWSALDAALKDEPIGEAAIGGAGWGLAFTAGLSVLGTATQAPEMRMAFAKAIQNVGKRFPGMLDKLGKPVSEEVEKEWLKVLSKSRGKDLRIIDLAKRERQMFRNAIRAAEKELYRAAEKEAAIKAYWSTKAAKSASPPTKPATAKEITKIIVDEPVIKPATVSPKAPVKVEAAPAAKEAVTGQAKFIKAGEEYKGHRIKIENLPKEDIARYNPDGTISVDPEKFYGHSLKDQQNLLEHEFSHFLESKISPQDKARYMDIPAIKKYRGRNINEKLANMIEDGKLPAEVLADYPDLAKQAPAAPEAGKVEKAIDKQQLESDEIALDDKELKPLIGEDMPKGIALMPNVGAIRDVYNRAHDWTLTFGQAKREDPELYDQLMKAYGKRNAGVENAIDQVDKILPKTIKIGDDVNMSMVYEDKRLSINPEQKETYDKFKALLDEMSAKQLEEGLYSQPFNERMIEENNVKIEKLYESLKHPNKSKVVAELRAENKVLAEMRYLPHSITAKRAIESKVNTLSGDRKSVYLQRMSAFYKKRTGKLFLKDYLEAGLITKDDMRMSRLATEEVADYYIRSAYKGLYDYGKAKGYVRPYSQELHDEGWLTSKELGISSPELKDQIVHPLFGSSLAEMKAMRTGRGSTLNQIFGMVKQGQFIKPTIVWVYDAVQKYMRGMYSLNPSTEAKAFNVAIRSVLEKDELYHRLNESNLFQFPYEISRAHREEEIAKFINQHSAEIDGAIKALEKITDTRWFDPDMTVVKMARNIITAAHRGMAQITWTGDKMQRTQSYLILTKMGYSHEEAVKVAANSHGGYSLLSEKYKEFMTKKTFVYSFRFLMPVEMGKTLAEPIIAAKDSMGGKKIPKAKWERMVKAVIATAVIPIATDEYMKWRGFKKEGKHLGPVAWKWSKEVTINGEKREIVVGMNNILNMPIKYWNRITQYNPIDRTNRGLQAVKNLAKWEAHPIYRIWFWDIMQNRKSFGSGVSVYDTEANPAIQFAQISAYAIGQSFRFFGQTMDAAGEGSMTDKERAEQEVIFDSALNDADKMLFWALGYKYVRQPIEERRAIMQAALTKELRERSYEYARKYEGEDLEKRLEGLKRWAMKSEKWIQKEMK